MEQSGQFDKQSGECAPMIGRRHTGEVQDGMGTLGDDGAASSPPLHHWSKEFMHARLGSWTRGHGQA